MNEIALTPVFLAALTSALATAWLRRHPAALAMLDRPGQHKMHHAPVPAIGGIGVVLGIALAWLLGTSGPPAVLPAGLLVLLAAGMLDDHRGVSARGRFLIQGGVALAMALSGDLVLRDFGELLWPGATLALGVFAIPVTVFCAVGVINAVNMIDGSDGLAGGLALLSLCAIAVLAADSLAHAAVPILLAAGAALIGFLAFNLRFCGRPARVFLGNGGSMAVGGLLAWFAIGLSQGEGRAFAPVTALWLLAVPLIDTVSVMWRRLVAGHSPFAADHQHVHHLLLRAGLSVNGTLGVVLCVHAGCIVVGIAGEWFEVAQSLRFGAFLLVALGLHALKVQAARRLPPLRASAVR